MFSSRTLTDRPLPDFDTREDFLEDHWDDECKCESKHRHPRTLLCSVEVIAKARNCARPQWFLVCSMWVAGESEWIEETPFCICGRPTRECSELIPA